MFPDVQKSRLIDRMVVYVGVKPRKTRTIKETSNVFYGPNNVFYKPVYVQFIFTSL